jgi:hypothetical protein
MTVERHGVLLSAETDGITEFFKTMSMNRQLGAIRDYYS